MRRAISWLVYDTVSEPTLLAGQTQFLCGRAELEHPDTITVTTLKGRMQAQCPYVGDPEKIAKRLLRELHQATAR